MRDTEKKKKKETNRKKEATKKSRQRAKKRGWKENEAKNRFLVSPNPRGERQENNDEKAKKREKH